MDAFEHNRCACSSPTDWGSLMELSECGVMDYSEGDTMSENTITPFPGRWVKTFNETELERLAIMTVDGGLTDDEALTASGLWRKLSPPRSEL